jgi:hypothetical protein
MVVYQSMQSGSIARPSRSQTALCPAWRPIGRLCWQDITDGRSPSIRMRAQSPAAKTPGTLSTRRKASTGTRPNASGVTGNCAVSGLARMPPHQTTVAASMGSLFVS